MAFKESQGSESAARRFTDVATVDETVIGSEVEMKGEIKGRTNLTISGVFEGEIEVEGLVWLKPGGRIETTLVATDVVLEGDAKGSFRARNKIDLRKTARVQGDITAGAIAMADGSSFEGGISMDGGASPSVVTYQEKRTPEDSPKT